MARKNYDPAVAQEQIRVARERLETAVDTLVTSEGWARYLRQQARFHRYSWGNTLLIWAQMNDASYLKGFKGWLDLGRCVRKGEKAIRILAPAGRAVRMGEDETGAETIVAAWQRFTTAAIFDVSQTEPIPGHAAPFDPDNSPYTGAEVAGDPDLAFETMMAAKVWIQDQGWTVKVGGELHPRANGFCRPSDQTIWVREQSRPEMLSTMIHEVAHALTYQTVNAADGYNVGEVVAESVAFIVCDYFGLDAEAPAAEYIAGWLGKDRAGFKKGLAAIQDTAHRMIEALAGASAPVAAAA